MLNMMNSYNKRSLPVFESPTSLELYDIQGAAYDAQLSVTSLVGLINRTRPRVYLLSNNDADSLFNALLTHVPHKYVDTDDTNVLDAMLKTYRDLVKGVVVYDPALPDSVNVATTLAGLRDAIVVSPQQAEMLQQMPYELPVMADLRVYGWKNRVQAYRWAANNLLKETTKQVVAGLNPAIAGGLRSYLVATRAFVYWLNPLHILPDPASGWTIERCLMKRILQNYPPETPHLGWFINEFAGIDMASKAALYTLPSDYFFNLEVWSAVQPSTRIEGVEGESRGETRATQVSPPGTSTTPAPTETIATSRSGGSGEDEGSQGGGKPRLYPATNEAAPPVQGTGGACPHPGNAESDSAIIASQQHIAPKIYVSFTISDGDNLQFDQHRMFRLWQDAARGNIPLGWTIAPALIEAAPVLAAYYQSTATHNDELIAGPSGAAYIWPSSWPANRLNAYLRLTGALMERMDLHTIQVLDGALSRLFPFRAWQEEYARSLSLFGVRGILVGDSYKRGGWREVLGVPVIKNLGLAKNVPQTLALIKNNPPAQIQGPAFLNIYIYAWSMTPSDICKVTQRLDSHYEVVTPGRLCALLGQAREGR